MIKRIDTLRDQAYDLIRDKIIRQELPFGARLSVAELSREFGISNSPIREAISLLETNGLVKNTPNFGFRVITLDEQVFNDLTQSMRVLLCGCLIDCIHAGKIPELIPMLEDRLELQKDKMQQDSFYDYCVYSINFDKAFVDVFHNELLTRMFESKFNLLEMCTVYAYDYRSDGVLENLHQHEDILRSLQEGRYDDTIELLYHHFDKHDLAATLRK